LRNEEIGINFDIEGPWKQSTGKKTSKQGTIYRISLSKRFNVLIINLYCLIITLKFRKYLY